MEEPEQPAKRRRSGAAHRLPFYVLLLLIGGPAAYLLSLRNPQDDVDRLERVMTDASKRRGFYRYRGASLGLYGSRGYSLTLYVGDTERFAPAQFLTLSRIDGEARAELMKHQGSAGVSVLTGGRLEAYLKRCQLDMSPIDRSYERWQQRGKPSER